MSVIEPTETAISTDEEQRSDVTTDYDTEPVPMSISSLTQRQKDVLVAAHVEECDSMKSVAEIADVQPAYARYVMAKYMYNRDIPVGDSIDERILSFRDRSFRDLTDLQQEIVMILAAVPEVSDKSVASHIGTASQYVDHIRVVYQHVIQQYRDELTEEERRLMAAEITSDMESRAFTNAVDSLREAAEHRQEISEDSEYHDQVLDVLDEAEKRLEL